MDKSESRLFLYGVSAAVGLAALYALHSYFRSSGPSARSSTSVQEKAPKRPALAADVDPAIVKAVELMEEATDEGWETIKSTPELSIYRKKTGDSPVAIIKAKVLIANVSVEDIMTVIWDVSVRVTWDSVMKGFRAVEVLSPDRGVIYFYVKPPVPFIAARDFVQLRCRERLGEDWVIAYKSVERADCELPEGYIRGETKISGYRIRRRGEKCEVDFISQTDVKGSLPVGLLNTIAPLRAQDWIKKMTAAAQSLHSTS